MKQLLLLIFLLNIPLPSPKAISQASLDALTYQSNYQDTISKYKHNVGYLINECQSIIAKDQSLRGTDTDLINDIENILMLSVIVENQATNLKNLNPITLQAINIVLTHNPTYFNKYFHKQLFEFVNSKRCDAQQSNIILMFLYQDLFGEIYIDNKTRLQSIEERNLVMKERLNQNLDFSLEINELCAEVISFLNQEKSFHEGVLIGRWGDKESNFSIRKKPNGEFYIIQSFFDFAFPEKRNLVSDAKNEFRYNTPYSTRTWKIIKDGTLNFKYTEDSNVKRYLVFEK